MMSGVVPFSLPLSDVIDAVRRPAARVHVHAVRPAAKAALLAQLAENGVAPILVVTASLEAADTLARDVEFICRLGGRAIDVQVVPDWNPALPPPIDLEARRVSALAALLEESADLAFAPIDALNAPLIGPSLFRSLMRTLERGRTVGRDALRALLVEAGYEMVSTVTLPGEAAVRGGVIDCFSPLEEAPIRIELDGDDIASLRLIDPLTQRSQRSIERARLGPAPSRVHETDDATLASYLPASTILVIDEPDLMPDQQTSSSPETSPRLNLLAGRVSERPADPPIERVVAFHALEVAPAPGWEELTIGHRSPQSLGFGTPGGSTGSAFQRAEAVRQRTTVIVTCRSREQATRLKSLAAEHGVPAAEFSPEQLLTRPAPPAPLFVAVGDLSAGLYDAAAHTLLLTEEEFLGKDRIHRPSRRARLTPFLSSIDELRVGDLAVHTDYGIGRYEGLARMTMGGVESEFLVLRYLGGDKIYVPLDRLDLVQKYSSGEGHTARMEALGGTGWIKTKQKVRREIQRMAADLLDLYAQRELAVGHAFSPDGPESREFAAGFEYEETSDQARAIAEVTADMERVRPMDRLVCGDVGYGKTEVAMRAAFKAIMDQKQVAVLVPTTLLAQQHGARFAARFAAFPVRVEVMSRFRSPAELRSVVKALADGQVDIVIGTHRLLQKDVVFRDLGLVVVDEEQRFGVRHKERFKTLRKSVDILTLTATPIPRTLQMSFAGARDLSLIETPPADRLAIRTMLSPFDPVVIQQAIRRELARGGQVFFVHNRVLDIERLAEQLRELVPEVRMVVGHGQLAEHQLERVMAKFLAGEADLLLSTTIIESGLDIPSANTILINRADQFGLAELYQLRGRVGRSGQQAYTILLIPPSASLSEEAHRRLEALQEFTELGSGFKIAARDLEIRGAGNLLGAEQSGHIAAVGFDLYLKMIQEAVDALRGSEPEPDMEPSLVVPVSAFIPEDYIADSYHRLAFYKRLTSADTPEALSALRAELNDRFGPPPEAVDRLFDVIALKQVARRLAVTKIEVGDRNIVIATSPRSPLSPDVADSLLKAYPRSVRFLSEYAFRITCPDEPWPQTHQRVMDLLQRLGAYDTQNAARP